MIWDINWLEPTFERHHSLSSYVEEPAACLNLWVVKSLLGRKIFNPFVFLSSGTGIVNVVYFFKFYYFFSAWNIFWKHNGHLIRGSFFYSSFFNKNHLFLSKIHTMYFCWCYKTAPIVLKSVKNANQVLYDQAYKGIRRLFVDIIFLILLLMHSCWSLAMSCILQNSNNLFTVDLYESIDVFCM